MSETESDVRIPFRCRLLGHKWSMEPPWSGAELVHRPHCERCDYEPEEIQIIGSADRPLDRTQDGEANA